MRYYELAKELEVEPEALTAAAVDFAGGDEPRALATVKPPELEAYLRERFTAHEHPGHDSEMVAVPGVIGEWNELTSDAEPEVMPVEDCFDVVDDSGAFRETLKLEPGLARRLEKILAGRFINDYLLDVDRGELIVITWPHGQKYRMAIHE